MLLARNLAFLVLSTSSRSLKPPPVTHRKALTVMFPLIVASFATDRYGLLTVPEKEGLLSGALLSNRPFTSVLVYTFADESCEAPRLLIAVRTLVVPTTREPLTVTLPLCTVLAPLTRSGALISTSRVPVPFISMELRAPAANLLAFSLMGCAVFVARTRPSFCPEYFAQYRGAC